MPRARQCSTQKAQQGRNRDLKNIAIQLVAYAEELDSNKQRAERKRDKAVDEGAVERDTTDGRGTHPT